MTITYLPNYDIPRLQQFIPLLRLWDAVVQKSWTTEGDHRPRVFNCPELTAFYVELEKYPELLL